jgi:hypothetical protein
MIGRRVGLGAVAASLAGALVLLAPGAASAGTLDQQQTDGSGMGVNATSTHSVGQTFTPGLSGKLDQVDLFLSKQTNPNNVLNVEIRDVAGTAYNSPPGTAVLASASVAASAVPASGAFVPIAFTAPASVAAGTRYAIVIWTAAGGGNYVWYLSTAHETYTGGVADDTNSSPPTTAWSAFLSDFAFKTYVTVPAVGPTGRRTAALKKCKKKHKKNHDNKKFKKCKKKARKLPV